MSSQADILHPVALDRPCMKRGCGRPATQVLGMIWLGFTFVCEEHAQLLWPRPAPPAVRHTGK